MKARRVEPNDWPTIKAWGEEWGADYDEDQFPEVGFIVDDVAAYFLYQTDSSVCWLENMVAKKDIPSDLRDRALNLLVGAILSKAVELGFTVAYATTDITSVAKRAKLAGATIQTGQLLITKDLTQPAHLQ